MKEREKENRKMSFKDVEVRSIFEGGKKFVEGIIPYNCKSLPMWGMTEIISKTAFKKTLADGSNVRALFNHEETKILGSTDSGTLTLENTEDGLVCRCELPDTSYANDMYEVINRKDCQTMSFGFTPVKTTYDNEKDERILKEVNLHEVSYCVPFPAYPATTSTAYTRGFDKRNIDIGALNETLEKDELSDSDKLVVTKTIDILNSIIEPKAVEGKPDETTSPQVDTSGSDEAIKDIQVQIEAEIAV